MVDYLTRQRSCVRWRVESSLPAPAATVSGPHLARTWFALPSDVWRPRPPLFPVRGRLDVCLWRAHLGGVRLVTHRTWTVRSQVGVSLEGRRGWTRIPVPRPCPPLGPPWLGGFVTHELTWDCPVSSPSESRSLPGRRSDYECRRFAGPGRIRADVGGPWMSGGRL